jgi:hypothetical protein
VKPIVPLEGTDDQTFGPPRFSWRSACPLHTDSMFDSDGVPGQDETSVFLDSAMIHTLIAYGLRLTNTQNQFKEELPDGMVKVFSALDRLSQAGVVNEEMDPALLSAVRAKIDIASLSEFPLVAPATGYDDHPVVLGFEVAEEALDSALAVDSWRDRWDVLVDGFVEPLLAQILVSAGADRPRIHVLAWDDGQV